MPANKKKEPKFLSFISQNFSSINRNKTNVSEKDAACPINTLSQLLEPSSLAVPKSNISLRTHKSKPYGPSSRQNQVDINNITDNISSGSSAMMNNTGVGCQKPVNVNQGSIINAPSKDSSGFAVPTMRAPRAQKYEPNNLIEELKQKAMMAWCIVDEDLCKKLFSILMIDCLNHIEQSGQEDNASQHGMSDENESINMVKDWLNKLDETACSGTVSFSGLPGPGYRDMDNVSSVSGYNFIRQVPSQGNLNLSEMRQGKPLLPRFMTIDASIVGLPTINPYGNQNDMMRSNAFVAGLPEQALSERAMSMRMDGSFMSNRNCMDNASIYSAMPYTPAYSRNNQFAYRGEAGNHHNSNAYFANRRLHSLMEDRENIPYNNENITYLDNTRRDQGFRQREFQPRVMLERLNHSENGLFKVPAFGNTYGRMGSVQDFQRSYNHHPRYFDTSSSVRRNMEENEDMQERCSNAPIQSEYRMKDASMIRRMNGGDEAVQENIGRPFKTRSKDSIMIRRMNENMQEKIGSRLLEDRSRDPSFLRRMNCNDSQKENVPRQSENRLRDSSMHHIRENNDRRMASNNDRQIRDQAVEDKTRSRPTTRSATRTPSNYSIVRHTTTVQVHTPTPAAARVMNQSKIVGVTRSGRTVRAPQTFWSADISYVSTANHQSIRGSKRKRAGH